MGIQGLLPLLKSIHKTTHLRNFAGQTLGVDAYGWLHRGTVACAIELAKGEPTRKHIDFALNRVRMLIHFGVKPYLVFDGAYLPSKEHTEKERAARRSEAKKLGLELLKMERLSQAYLELQKAVDVTPSMARELIEELKLLDVPYVVAPYEADSQLAYLEKQNAISGVISEDSDLLVFGVKCLLTKLDQYGECVMINRADFTACREISLVGWSDKEFRMMAMLSGCDYLPGIDQMGLKTAYRLVRKHKAIERTIRSMQLEGKKKVPRNYLEAFNRAERTFLYQWVFCPEAQRLVNLNKVPAELENEDMSYVGEDAEAHIAIGVATGELDPNTKELLQFNKNPGRFPGSATRAVQTPSEKSGRPISDYFKPMRTPLAELDPNSFAPSPSQQNLLQSQRNASWSASQVQPLRPSTLNRVASASGPSSAPPGARRAYSDLTSNAGRKSPKRRRLCSDSGLAASVDSNASVQSTTSRFFSGKDVEPSPSLRKPSAQRRRTDDFEIFSDDSTIEAMAEMAAVEESNVDPSGPSPKKRRKLQVYSDTSPPMEEAPAVGDSQSTINTSIASGSQKTIETETPDTSFEAAGERNIFNKGIDEDFAALKAKYSFQSVSPRKKFISKSTRSGDGLSRIYGSLQGVLPPSKTSPASIDRGEPSTAGEGEDCEESTVIVPASSPPQVVSESPKIKPCQGDYNNRDQYPLEKQRRCATPTSSMAVQGSEDFIPESPDSIQDERECTGQLNLNRFAFAGAC